MLHFRFSSKLFALGIGVKRWLLTLTIGVLLVSIGIALGTLSLVGFRIVDGVTRLGEMAISLACVGAGFFAIGVAVLKLSRVVVAPYRKNQQGRIIDTVYDYHKRQKGMKVIAIGGGTGLPSVLRGFKQFTGNITAVVTVADDGGSSGRLRRELGVLPPGDLRNNIAALADDENLMAQLFQYRFESGDLGGHAFGNLFITALAGVTGSIETALIETERILNIRGRVLPATLEVVNLVGSVRLAKESSPVIIEGESQITQASGIIEEIYLNPPDVSAYSESVRAILDADLVVIGPGSLFTSIIPNLLVKGIAEALRATNAYIIYVCNVATQPGETDGFTVAEHVMGLEKHIGRGIFHLVLANNVYPSWNAGNTNFVKPVPEHHEILQRYEVRYADLTDPERPWRHDPQKLVGAIRQLSEEERLGTTLQKIAFTET
jgi:uncharacterized cofD-like protein